MANPTAARILALLLGAVGCASDAGRGPAASSLAELELVVDPRTPRQSLPAWLGYGAARLEAIQERPATRHNRSLDDFAIELEARRMLVEIWKELRSGEPASDPYLDALVEIHAAGHLEEYVLAIFGRPGWTLPPSSLDAIDFPAFLAYAEQHLRGHVPQTLVQVRGGGLAALPEEPGASLPELQLQAADGSFCRQLEPARQALARWYTEAGQLDGVPLAAADAGELAASLLIVRGSPDVRARGVTWVSPLAAITSFHVGFCEIDRKDHAAAVGPMETAVQLYPDAPMWRLELAQALTVVKRFDEAEQVVDGVIRTAKDECLLGVAWRRRGYVRIDRGDLHGAYDAYAQSLEHDPANAIARSELALIRTELAKVGEEGDLPAEYEPPPMGSQVVKRCPGS